MSSPVSSLDLVSKGSYLGASLSDRGLGMPSNAASLTIKQRDKAFRLD
jgi:hypothetical protein